MALYDHIFHSDDISKKSSYFLCTYGTYVEHDVDTCSPPLETQFSSQGDKLVSWKFCFIDHEDVVKFYSYLIPRHLHNFQGVIQHI